MTDGGLGSVAELDVGAQSMHMSNERQEQKSFNVRVKVKRS